MVLLANHEATELANHGTRPRSLVKVKNALVAAKDVMTIPLVNLVMTKMLLVKPKLLRPQFSFDDFLADETVVDDADVIETLTSLASL